MTKKTYSDEEYKQTLKRVAAVSAEWNVSAAISQLKDAGPFGDAEIIKQLEVILKKLKAARASRKAAN